MSQPDCCCCAGHFRLRSPRTTATATAAAPAAAAAAAARPSRAGRGTLRALVGADRRRHGGVEASECVGRVQRGGTAARGDRIPGGDRGFRARRGPILGGPRFGGVKGHGVGDVGDEQVLACGIGRTGPRPTAWSTAAGSRPRDHIRRPDGVRRVPTPVASNPTPARQTAVPTWSTRRHRQTRGWSTPGRE